MRSVLRCPGLKRQLKGCHCHCRRPLQKTGNSMTACRKAYVNMTSVWHLPEAGPTSLQHAHFTRTEAAVFVEQPALACDLHQSHQSRPATGAQSARSSNAPSARRPAPSAPDTHGLAASRAG